MTATTDERHPPTEQLRLDAVLAALADPVRLAMIRTLAAMDESPCHQLHNAAGLQIGRSTFSHHQRILREAGVIAERINGAQRILRLRRNDLDSRFPGLMAAILDSED